MSLKITSESGFIIGSVLNPSITEIYIRSNVDMSKQEFVYSTLEGEQTVIEYVNIFTKAKVNLLGGIMENAISIENISPIYWLKYSATVQDMNILYFEIDTDLKNRLLEINPDWVIEIVQLGVY